MSAPNGPVPPALGPALEFLRRAGAIGFAAASMGLTLVVGALAIVVVRAYVLFGERAADLAGPDLDTSARGLIETGREIALGPGIHRVMAVAGGILAILGVTLCVGRGIARRAVKRRSDRDWAELSEAMRGRGEGPSGGG